MLSGTGQNVLRFLVGSYLRLPPIKRPDGLRETDTPKAEIDNEEETKIDRQGRLELIAMLICRRTNQ